MEPDTFSAQGAAHDDDWRAASTPGIEEQTSSAFLASVADHSSSHLRESCDRSGDADRKDKRSTARVPASLAIPDVLSALLACGERESVAAHLWLSDADGQLQLLDSVGSVRPSPQEGADPGSVLRRALTAGHLMAEPLRRVTTIESEVTVWRFALPVVEGEQVGVAALDVAAPKGFNPKSLRKALRAQSSYLSGALAVRAVHLAAESAHHLTDALGSLATQDDPREIVSECLTRALELARADSGSVMLVDPASRTMHIAASVGLPNDVVDSAEVSEGEGVSGWVLATGEPLAIEDLDGESLRSKKLGKRSAISVPLGDAQGVLGVLNVARRGVRGRLDRSDLQTMESLGRFSAIVLRRARLSRHERETYFGTLAALAAAMDSRDPDSAGENRRIADLSAAVGQTLGLDARDIEALRVGALLRDIGMVTGTKAGERLDRPLSTVEWGMVKVHPLVAVDILAKVPALADVVPIVRHHHEHWDGSGYVAGLAAERIPLGARILAVTDAFVAMTSPRSHRGALPTLEALDELRAKAGSQFDPSVVRALVAYLGAGADAQS